MNCRSLGRQFNYRTTASFNKKLIIADKDINENWERYKERYFRRIKR